MSVIDTTKATKSTVAGDDGFIIVPQYSRFVTQLNMKPWKKLALGFFISSTKPGDPNATYTIASATGQSHLDADYDKFFIGLFPVADWVHDSFGVHSCFYIGTWSHSQYRDKGGRLAINRSGPQLETVTRSDSAGDLQSSSSRQFELGHIANAAATDNFADFIYMEFEKNASDAKVYYRVSGEAQAGALTLAALESEMGGTISKTTHTHSVIPEGDLDYLILQHPLCGADLRIHAWRAAVLEEL